MQFERKFLETLLWSEYRIPFPTVFAKTAVTKCDLNIGTNGQFWGDLPPFQESSISWLPQQIVADRCAFYVPKVLKKLCLRLSFEPNPDYLLADIGANC